MLHLLGQFDGLNLLEGALPIWSLDKLRVDRRDPHCPYLGSSAADAYALTGSWRQGRLHHDVGSARCMLLKLQV